MENTANLMGTRLHEVRYFYSDYETPKCLDLIQRIVDQRTRGTNHRVEFERQTMEVEGSIRILWWQGEELEQVEIDHSMIEASVSELGKFGIPLELRSEVQSVMWDLEDHLHQAQGEFEDLERSMVGFLEHYVWFEGEETSND